MEHNKKEQGEESPSPASNLPPKEILDNLPEHVRVSIVEAASFSGPLPPPTMYREYESALPGSAERILAMVEKEQKHRIMWETTALNHVGNDCTERLWTGNKERTVARLCHSDGLPRCGDISCRKRTRSGSVHRIGCRCRRSRWSFPREVNSGVHDARMLAVHQRDGHHVSRKDNGFVMRGSGVRVPPSAP